MGTRTPVVVLSEPALEHIVKAAMLPVAADDEVKAACLHLLEYVARQGIFRPADYRQLSKRHDLTPLLKAWGRWRRCRRLKRARANAAFHRLVRAAAKASGKGFGPMPSPIMRPLAFAHWLADMSLAFEAAADVLEAHLTPGILRCARKKAEGVADTLKLMPAGVGADGSRHGKDGGHQSQRERDLRTEKLLIAFWLLFDVAPTSSIANSRLRAPDEREATPADGGAAVRFIVAFEAEVAAAIADGIGAPLGKPARPGEWEAHPDHNISQHLERLFERRERRWEKWAILRDRARMKHPDAKVKVSVDPPTARLFLQVLRNSPSAS